MYKFFWGTVLLLALLAAVAAPPLPPGALALVALPCALAKGFAGFISKPVHPD